MNTNEILEQIDSALDDWTVGPDAMRCNPEPMVPPAAGERWSSLSVAGYIEELVRIQSELTDATPVAEGWEVLPWQRALLEREYWLRSRVHPDA